MIRATYTWLTTNETGSILEWCKPGVHLSPYHFEVIRNHAFSEFFPEENEISVHIEKDGQPVARYDFQLVSIEGLVIAVLTDLNTGKEIKHYYSAERCL